MVKTYKSTYGKPTKQKKEIFDLMEKHKSRGTTPIEPLNRLIKRRGHKVYMKRNRFDVYNKRGTNLVSGNINKKNRINMWAVK